jgi:glycerol-3-phosphate acyltransferase PlsY
MADVVQVLAALGVGYLLGTLPSADLVTWIATRGRVDIRASGSGNPGAFNALHVIGKRGAAVVLALDLLKGVAAGLVGWAIAGDSGAYAAALAAVAGHIFPVWTGFRGGKGVATAGGTCLTVFPLYAPFGIALCAAIALLRRRADLAMTTACAASVVAAALVVVADWPNLWGPDPSGGLLAYTAVGSAMIIGKFRAVQAVRASSPGATSSPTATSSDTPSM